ncbi:TatD family hydrolase [Marivirga arenosa]|uniref:TatD family hydrolase n=1 Tax=Marivirga arenosa TaxID=3059076 RepID=A0AA51ZSC5_9BACT|nr:TatD family hydrolase [Marivirga sp. BKB1-2]WNB16975.1 TatD family hydrolase [Marivirga sp. BKB1-2]
MIETHAHLYVDKFDEDRQEMMERAEEAGVKRFYMPNIDHKSIEPMLEVEEKFSNTIATMGVHPCSVEKHFEKQLYEVEDWLNKRKFAAVGEIGLDYYWDKSLIEQQKEALRIQVQFAKDHQIPVILHCRDSFDDTYDIIKKMNDDKLKGVFHCFTGTAEEAQKVIDLGFFIGIGGVVTFKNGGLAEHIPDIDLNRIVLETDAPYLAPTPKRGKRNEPAFLDLIAQKLADLKEMSKSDLIEITSKNATELFS